MEDMGWERNMLFPWSNISRHQHQQEIEETFIFGSENNMIMNPITATTGRRMCSHLLPPATVDSINAASSFNAASQHWSQTVAVISGFHDGKNTIPISTTAAAAAPVVTSPESLDCLFSATNSTAGDSSSDHDDGLSVLFPDYKTLCNNNMSNPGGDSVIDDGIVSQCSPEKKPNTNFGDYDDNPPRSKKPRSDPSRPTSSTINFRQGAESGETDTEAIAQMKEMIYREAAFRPVSFADEAVVEKPKRKNVRISSDPQTVAARQRREKISERIRVLQKLVPGGSKMDTASMLDEAANYLKFLRSQVKALEQFGQKLDYVSCGGTTTNAQSTSQMIQNIDSYNVTVGVPFPMHTHFLLPHQQLYPTPPPA